MLFLPRLTFTTLTDKITFTVMPSVQFANNFRPNTLATLNTQTHTKMDRKMMRNEET
jgi:hypothetical protein